MKGKWRKRAFVVIAAMMAGLFMSAGMPELATDIQSHMTFADAENVISLSQAEASASDKGLIKVKILATGTPGQAVSVTYRTKSGTAIENVDYLGVNNTAKLKINSRGNAEYEIAIQCLNDAEGREKLRVVDSEHNYGRYFTLNLSKPVNASLGTVASTKCRLLCNYQVSATVGLRDDDFGREVAYLDDYKNMQAKYHKGDGDISGKESWKTWKEGVSFNNDTSTRWMNAYINPGLASAYGTYILKSIDDDHVHSSSNIYMASGNKEFMEKYKSKESVPGCSLYYEIEPCTSGGYRLDGKAMYYISQNKNPNGPDGDLVDLDEFHFAKNPRRIYWIQDKDAWFSGKNSIYDTVFYKTDPYNGVLDYGLAIFNNNKSWDREVHDIWMFLALVDETAPTITKQYCEYNTESNALRFFLRFNEPVYASKKKALTVTVNSSGTKYYADYVEGNYSDTLVYELPVSAQWNFKVNSLIYELPNDDIGDMAYILNGYKTVTNNLIQNTDMKREASIANGLIDLAKPALVVDIEESLSPRGVYNLILSANNNGQSPFDTGTVYYHWSKEPTLENDTDPASYAYSHVLTSEEMGSFGVTLVKNDTFDSGDYYLHALAVTQYGPDFGELKPKHFGPYRLDGDAPEVQQVEPTVNDLQKKIFRLQVMDKSLGTKINSVAMNVIYKDAEGVEQVAQNKLIVEGEIPTDLSGIVDADAFDGYTEITYSSNIDEADDTTPLDKFITNLMGTRPQLEVEVYFDVADAAGNKAKTSSLSFLYDKRTLFPVDVAAPASYVKDTSLPAMTTDVYDITAAGANDGMTFTVTDPDTKTLIDDGAELSVVVNGETTFKSDGYSITLAGLAPGFYQANAVLSGTAGLTEVNLVSARTSFYLTKGMDDATVNRGNAQGNLVLRNRVFQFEDLAYYYFDSERSIVATHAYGATYNTSYNRYEGGSSDPAFSSSVRAKQYIKFMEYQDLELISLSASVASLLNGSSGSTIYVKAPKETKNAQEGQLWVRYKKATWTNTSGSSGWAFYYYGEGNLEDGINYTTLSENLNAAIDTVTTRILNSGFDRYLVGEDYTNPRTLAPHLSDAQMHVARESVSTSHMGTAFTIEPVFPGDAELYQNTVTIDGDPYPLATNLPLRLDTSTSLYFRDYGGTAWNKLDVEDGTLLKKALSQQATGLYTIREYGPAGVSEFTVYLDRDLPKLEVTLNKGIDGEESHLTLDGNVTTITSKNISLDALIAEADDQAYVAVYSYPNRSLLNVFYKDAFTEGYLLSDGNYYLEVGDRSGNTVTYIIRAADAPMDIEITENDSGVYVRVNNRDDVEIYSYEVYLNENLIDNEFAASKFFRGSGIFRVEITDIYGNTETLTKSHEAPSPELTWYYLNDNGGYSVYDSERPGRMKLQDDPNSSKTTNVLSSTTVRVLINGVASGQNVEFEVLDIAPTDYTYNASTGLLTISTLAAWRLRVWYAGQPENDHLYVFRVDATAPQVNGNFNGTVYRPVVVDDGKGNVTSTSTFDNIDQGEKYKEGDLVTLDSLAYELAGQESMNFESGAIISGNRVIISLNDPSGIRSVTVTRNGQELEMEPEKISDTESRLTLSSYGTYVITVVDDIGNIAVFTFANIEDDISSGTVDGVIQEENILTYGHDNLQVDTEYDGTTVILVQGQQGSYTYEFHYENGVLTYGKYYVHVEERVRLNDQDEEETYLFKYAEYQQTEGYSLDIYSDLVRTNVWYAVVENEEFTIDVMIDVDGHANYRVTCADAEIHAEIRYDVGNSHLPQRYSATLSREDPTLVLLTGGQEVERVESLDYIYITDDLTIDEENLPSSIVKIEYCYSQAPNFGPTTVLYDKGEWLEHLKGTEFGFYKIVVTNRYNNQAVYLISKIESFASIVTVRYLDGSSNVFYDNEGTFYSNYAIDLTVMSTEVHFEIDGQTASGIVEGGTTTLTLSRDGNYSVRVVGTNGIFENFTFEIKSDAAFVYKPEWITGYNEDALLYEQGYTNTKCTVSVGDEVVFIDMMVGEDYRVVLYNALTGDKVLDEDALVEVIGKYGLGKYEVRFRNKYGDLATHTVHYNNSPSIILTRAIASDPTTYQTFDLELAKTRGFYSNHILCFSTHSETYVFTINGTEYRLDEPKTIEFSNVSGIGSFSYRVTFRDEYGNYVEFDAILYRDEVEFSATEMNIITVGTTLYTKDDVVITFAEGLKATLSVDGGPAKDYLSGEVHYADGAYHFVVRDIAGNIATYDIVHKSVNHYSLTNSVNGEDVIDGGVINGGSVVFSSEEGSKIKYVVRDGELIGEYTSQTFNATGHYEILIEDGIGNRSYEEFTIINNDLAEFTYVAPFEFEVTEVWRINEDGTREMLNTRGPKITLDVNGSYVVVVSGTKTTVTFNFSVTINNTPPSAVLVGVADGEVTARDVTLSGLHVGDVVRIYKDGVLISTTTVTISSDVPAINSGGKYRVTVTNLQGVTVEYNFTRKAITNVAGSIFFIVFSALLVVGLGIGLIYHTKLKTDD